MKKTNLYPALAVVLGALGCALRRRQIHTDFDELNLPVPGLATHGLVVMTAVCLVGFALSMLPLKGGRDWESALGEEALLPLRGGALLHIAAGVMLALQYHSSGVQESVFPTAMLVLPVLLVLGALASGVGLWFAGGGGGKKGQNLVLCGFFGCFWTVNAYHGYATDPVVLHFVWFLLSVVCGALGWYELTALALNRGNARRCFYLCLVTVVLSMTALAGGEGGADQLLLLSQVVCFLTVSVRMAGRWGAAPNSASETLKSSP